MISISINVVNVILEFIIDATILYIREDEKSSQRRTLLLALFITQFFNTGILLLMASADFSESNNPILRLTLSGLYTDFTSKWFSDVGAILVSTTIINAFIPLIEFLITFGITKFLQYRDRSYTNDTYVTKCESIN